MSLLSLLEHPKDQAQKLDRRTFMKNLGLAGAAAATTAASQAVCAPHVWAQGQTYNWRMATTWPRGLAIFHSGAERFAKEVEARSEGRLKIQVFAGGELVPAFDTFDAVSKGTVDVGHSVSFYWEDKIPAAPWFSAVPFGFNAQGINAWFYSGDGLQLWEEVYAPFNVVPRPVGNTGVQMGGWFKRKVISSKDLKGMKVRMGGLGAKVLTRAGATVMDVPGGEVLAALESGKVDAAEWVGPVHDLQMGLYKAAKYYYYPGWHEPGSAIEVLFNKKAYDSLPGNLRNILDDVAMGITSGPFANSKAKTLGLSKPWSVSSRFNLCAFQQRCLTSSESSRKKCWRRRLLKILWSKRSTHLSRLSKRIWTTGGTSRRGPSMNSWQPNLKPWSLGFMKQVKSD